MTREPTALDADDHAGLGLAGDRRDDPDGDSDGDSDGADRADDGAHDRADGPDLDAVDEGDAPRLPLQGGRARYPERDHADLVRLAGMAEDDPARAALRERVLESHLPLVHHLARRFKDRGEPLDDLVQVGTIGLIKAVDRYDPDRGVGFAAYAVPTVVGEIKRHFRDKGWAVRVPRRLQELGRTLSDARSVLTQELGRAPTVAELAERTGTDQEAVLEALESAGAYSTVPLPEPGPDSPEQAWFGEEDPALDGVVDREALRPLLAQLPTRERRILALRFVRGMSQSQIAAEVGISQMHVSRLLARTLGQLREGLTVDDDA